MKADDLKKLQDDYKRTFTTEYGKNVMEHLEGLCFTKSTTFNKDPQTLAFNEGKRAVYLHINTMMEMDVDKIAKIMEQNRRK